MQEIGNKSQRKPVIGFYWRKALFFGGLVFAAIFMIENIGIYKADINFYEPLSTSSELTINLNIEKNGSIQVDGRKISDRIAVLDSSEELRLPLLDNSGTYYDKVTIKATLPERVANQSKHEIITSHGVDTAVSFVEDNQTIVFESSGVAGTAMITPVINMPRGTINPPVLSEIYALASGVKSNGWILIGLFLPLLTLIFMVIFIMYQLRRQHVDIPTLESDAPPMALPSAVVGVLVHQKVGPRELAATLIDLALRGDIVIVDREKDFAFVKNRFDRRLLTFEKILLSKIFRTSIVSNKSEVESRINSHLYSRKISLVTSGIYTLATRLGYFKVNPQKLFLRYQLIGTAGIFFAVAGFIVNLKFFSDLSYIAFLWIGMMASSLVILITARNIPIRTTLGQEALSNWLSFKKYLSSSEKLPYGYDSQEIFQKYLPYAIVLECEVAWAKRFSEQNFTIPSWFETEKSSLTLSDFCLSLFPIISYVSRSLAAIREPVYK